METLGSLRRTNYCGEVTLAMAGQEMTVCGSIARARDKGGIIFADLRDTTGILQLVFDEDTPKDVFAKAESLKSEYVVICRGKLRERAAKTDKIATGDVELYVSELRILSEAQTTPFELRDEINVNDDLRLRYRYLDLRRPSMHEPIVLRSKIMQIIRNYFCENHFTEIETPTLIKSTPEGARDYLVPSRVQPGHFYALPQSPQLYKQILMLSGFDRYFQLAHCYRDEDLRADRQPEFTQVDEEMSFVSEDDIMTLNEGLIKRLWKEMLNVDVETPFYRMPWDEAMGRFGSDKPDTRFGLEIQDVTEVFRGTEFKPFAAVLEAGGTIRAINAKGLADKLSRKNIDKLGEVAKTYGAKGLAYSRLTADGTSSSFEKFLTDAEKAALYAALNAETGDVLLLVSDTDWVKACTALGQVRLDIARKHGLIDPDKFNFLWVVDFPLFEYSEQEGRWMAMHHPFTLPKAEDLDKVESDPGACHAVAYDIVLNGVEMGGGSMRINDPALQDRMFHALGFTEEKARESFGFLMDAYKFGAPPHGGMAYGLDRMVMLMLKLDGLTVKLTYEKGLLMEAATRGDGDIGENITHNVLGISGIPDKISYKERLVVTGEAFIRPSDFAALKDTLRDGNGEPYKNGRNLAAGSVRLLDCGACKDRRVTFMAFNVLEGFEEYPWKSQRLRAIEQLGFPICKYLASKQALTQFDMDAGIRHLRKYAQENDIPIDGIVVTYNDAAYARSCGRTGHHYKDGLAFKFEDDAYETVLRSIEWTPSRTGEIAPVAIFDTVEIDGCAVSRASLHNLSFIENLELAPGCRIKVSKRNQIIPHVEENLDRNCYSRDKVIPARCPCCGQPTRIHMTKNTVNGLEKVTAALFCDNEHCETRKLRKFVHFASPKALNIMGLSESILEKFIGNGWLHSYMDIFALDKHRTEIVQMEGFGEKSWQNLWDAIQHSRITTFEQYLTAMDIPMVGSTASKSICQRFRGNLSEFETAVCMGFDFTQLPDFGETLHRNIHQWFRSEENWTIWTELRRLVCIKTYQPPAASTDMGNPFVGKTLVVTGKVEPYTRDGINAKIESLGAHAGSSVSSKTDYLICGENAGSKLAKAQELGIKILSPDEFFRMAGESA